MAVDVLAQHLLGDAPGDALAEEVTSWLSASRRFRAFAEDHRDKIRKKLRTAGDAEGRADVRAELRTASLLVADRRIELRYEAYGSGKAGPDFTVALRGEQSFNLEVTRLRAAATETGLIGTLVAKLRQLPPGAPNALLVAAPGDDAGAVELDAAARRLRSRADSADPGWFAARGFADRRAFYDRFLRLGGAIVWCEGASGDARANLWINRSARMAISDQALRASLACLRAA